jgi:hypothetical protein
MQTDFAEAECGNRHIDGNEKRWLQLIARTSALKVTLK